MSVLIPRVFTFLMTRQGNAVLNFLRLSLMIIGLLLAAGFVKVLAANAFAVGTSEAVISQPGLVDPTAAAQQTEPAAETLTPRMQAALNYTARRYRVATDALVPVFTVAQTVGRERNVDPLLIVAIIGIESGFNPFAESSMGAQGLMQVIPRFHQDKLPEGAGKSPFLDPITNVQTGVLVLEEAIRQRGGLMAGLQQYGGATSDEEQTYATKVLAEKQRLEQAASRRNAATA